MWIPSDVCVYVWIPSDVVFLPLHMDVASLPNLKVGFGILFVFFVDFLKCFRFVFGVVAELRTDLDTNMKTKKKTIKRNEQKNILKRLKPK